jgi:hypothetical protein
MRSSPGSALAPGAAPDDFGQNALDRDPAGLLLARGVAVGFDRGEDDLVSVAGVSFQRAFETVHQRSDVIAVVALGSNECLRIAPFVLGSSRRSFHFRAFGLLSPKERRTSSPFMPPSVLCLSLERAIKLMNLGLVLISMVSMSTFLSDTKAANGLPFLVTMMGCVFTLRAYFSREKVAVSISRTFMFQTPVFHCGHG